MRTLWAAVVLTAVLVGLSSSPAAKSSDDFPREGWAVWTVTTKTSSHPTPWVRRICMNSIPSQMEWWTCVGETRAPEAYPPSNNALSCTDETGKHADSVTMWKNGLVERYAETGETLLTERRNGPKLRNWAETMMVYGGQCPVAYMGDAQAYLVIDRSNKVVFDPNKTTDCMIDVLKGVEGVSEPKVGYVMSAAAGPQPYIQYTFPGRRSHNPATIVFSPGEGEKDDPSKPSFMTTLGGFVVPPDTEPDYYGAKTITKLWKDRCGVVAGVMTV